MITKPATHNPYFVQLIHTLEPLLRRYLPLARMDFDDLCDWLAWYWNRGTMAYVVDEDRPLGVCLIRLFSRLDQFMDRDVFDPVGEFCFIELSIAEDGSIMWKMLQDLIYRWGKQKIIVWDRGARTETGAPRMYNWDQFIKLARRLSNTKTCLNR
jgi:hypothetical protein